MSRGCSEEKRKKWKEKVEAYKESGQNAVEWCRGQQISYNTLGYWRKQFEKLSDKGIEHGSFIELKEEPIDEGMTLEYKGVKIHLTKEFDGNTLRRCLQILKEAAC